MSDDARLIAEVIVVTLAFAAIIAASMYVVILERRRFFGPNNYLIELSERLDRLEREREQHERERRRDLEQMTQLKARITEQEIGLRILTAQLQRAGLIPEWTPPPMPPEPPPPAPPRDGRALAQILSALFSRDELDDLAFRLDINSEEIGGETRGKRARSLVDYAERHGMTDELVAMVRKLRPEGEI